MIAGFLKIILFLVLTIVIVTAVGIFKLVQHMRNISQKFGGQQTYDNTKRSHQTSGESEVIDTRSTEKANRKIFSKDEGEFVDYKEE